MSEAKRLAAEKALEYVEDGMIVGVGTGSTVAYFIDGLARIQHRIKGTVSSSEQSTARLKQHGIEVLESVPLVVGVGAFNEGYLDTKRDRMGHELPGQLHGDA